MFCNHIFKHDCDSRNFFKFFLSLDFHGLWHSVISARLFTELAMGYVSTGMGEHFSTLLLSLMALQLALLDRNSFRPCSVLIPRVKYLKLHTPKYISGTCPFCPFVTDWHLYYISETVHYVFFLHF